MRHGVPAVFVWNFYCCFFCPVLVVTWCACKGFLFLICSFLVNFTNLSLCDILMKIDRTQDMNLKDTI